MNSLLLIINIIFLLSFSSIRADALDDSWGSFKSTMSGIGDGIKDFGEGIAESFGKSPPGYHYSFRVFNNSSKEITARARSVKKVQGMAIKGSDIKKLTIAPGSNSGTDGFHDISYYLDVVLDWGSGKLTKSIVNAIKSLKNDSTIYSYNVYETDKGVAGEYLGQKTTSGEFLGSVYNSLGSQQTVTFPYAGQTFSTQLDPHSFNTLQSVSDIPYCVRPATGSATINFGSAGSIKIPSEGLGSGVFESGKWTKVNPMQYHYEIIADGSSNRAVTAGFSIGHFTQATTERLRNLSPVKCLVWNKSAEQMADMMQKYPDVAYIDQSKRSLWVVYSTPGWSNKTAKVNNTIMTQVPLGKALQFYFMRPLIDGKNYPTAQEILHTQDLKPNAKLNKIDISALNKGDDSTPKDKKSPGLLDVKEDDAANQPVVLPPINVFAKVKEKAPKTSKADLYIISLDTTDATQAKKFLNNLLQGKIAIPQGPSDKDLALTDEHKTMLLSGKTLEKKGVLTDKGSGVTGLLLVHDIFTPYGMSPGPKYSGPHYYLVQPPYTHLTATIYATLSQYLSSASYKNKQENLATLQAWVAEMAAAKTAKDGIATVRPKVEEFLKNNGRDFVFALTADGKRDKTMFSKAGILAVDFILTGPNSFAHLPLVWSEGISYFTYSFGAVPSVMDDTTKKSVVAWKPSGTINLLGKKV